MAFVNIALETFGIIITLFILLGCIFERKVENRQTGLFIIMLSVNMLVLFCDLMTYVLEGKTQYTLILYILNFLVYSLGYLLTALFTYYLIGHISKKTNINKRIANLIGLFCIIAAVLVSISLYNKMYFSFIDGIYVRGQLYWISQVYPVCIMIFNMYLILKHRKAVGLHDTLALSSYVVISVVAMLIQIAVYGITLLYMATTLSLFINYIMIWVEQGNQLKEKELELTRNRISIMLSQIQPHFLYNSLNTIQNLCRKDPQKAEEVVQQFADYLRCNLDSLNQRYPVPFSTELAHTKCYIDLEKERFGDKINIIYDFNVKDFMIPVLTLQPIVENAVRYGITRSKHGGTIVISTNISDNIVTVTVTDNGVGFDASISKEDGKTHIGINNVKHRLHDMCGGDLLIESKIGEGTVAKLIIPQVIKNKGEELYASNYSR